MLDRETSSGIDVQRKGSMSQESICNLLRLAASVEQESEHPLANAIVQEAKRRNISLVPIRKTKQSDTQGDNEDHNNNENNNVAAEETIFQVLPGKGVRCTIEGKDVVVGTQRLMRLNAFRCFSFSPLLDTPSPFGPAMLSNAIQWNSKQFNAMQCISMHFIQCNSMQFNSLQCDSLKFNAIQFNSAQLKSIRCNSTQFDTTHAIQCNHIQFYSMQCNSMQCNAIQCNSMQFH